MSITQEPSADKGVSGPIFISHTSADRFLAEALIKSLKQLSGSDTRLTIRSSTSEQLGPQGGEQWRDWISRQVVDAQTALIVVSPQALGKHWLLWESGACMGAELVRKKLDSNGVAHQVISVAFGVSEQECPDPLRGNQVVDGLSKDRMRKLFRTVLSAHGMVGEDLADAMERMEWVMPAYLTEAREALLQAPSVVNEPNVQDWLSRLDMLSQEKRWSDLPAFERWMMLAFGRVSETNSSGELLPIDVRLHRRLGQLYLDLRQYSEASIQLRLAWRLAPRDIFVLRPLATANLKQLLRVGTESASTLQLDLERQLLAIRELDPLFEQAPDTAALVANYLRRVLNRSEDAARVLQLCLSVNPDSYYVADLLAQTRLQQGLLEQARRDYEVALDITQRVADQSQWRLATAATASIALGKTEDALRNLGLLAQRDPALTPGELQSIQTSLSDVMQAFGLPDAQRLGLIAALRAPSNT